MAVIRLPMARWRRAAVTVESTPPESPHTTRPSLTVSRMFFTDSSMNPAMVHPPEHLAMLKRKFLRISLPRGVCTTSGWNWTP